MDVEVVEEGVADAMPADGSACCVEKLVWTWLGRPRRRYAAMVEGYCTGFVIGDERGWDCDCDLDLVSLDEPTGSSVMIDEVGI